jgi:hypothetical protein
MHLFTFFAIKGRPAASNFAYAGIAILAPSAAETPKM